MDHRKLHELDGQWVRIIDGEGLAFEGRCELDDAEYCLHEYGRAEDALNIDNWLFYGSDIQKAEAVEPGDVGLWMGKPLHRMRLDASAMMKANFREAPGWTPGRRPSNSGYMMRSGGASRRVT